MIKSFFTSLFSAIFLFSAFLAHAQDGPRTKPATEPKVWVTDHRGTFNGKTINYQATAGETILKDKDGNPMASIFSVAYVKTAGEDPRTRPVVFLYNGGPGSAALWLHMGAFGPKKLVLPSDPEDDGAAPYTVVDNPDTILDVADIVFIDPVGTGYSRPLGEHKGKEFWGITEDATSIADFIRLWITQNERWNSPKYIGGESYGTYRTSAVVNELEGGVNDLALNGVILISAVQSFWDSNPQAGNDDPYVNFLPTMAAAAVYHGKVDLNGQTLEAFLDEVRTFALEEYLPALFQGDRLDEAHYDEIKQKLSHYIGISETYLDQTHLRVDPQRFFKELLRDRGLTIGRLDGRFTGVDYDNAGEYVDWDPSFYGIDGSFTAAVNDYMRRELGVEFDQQYEVLSFQVNSAWERRPEGNDFIYGVGQYLGRASRENKDFRVWVAAGYYDFATPFFGIENALARVGMAPGRTTFTYYPAGHMMYIHHPSLQKLLQDARTFIEGGE